METYDDIVTYKKGIYIHVVGKKSDYHAVTIVGWGYDPTYRKEYWVVRNSWGSKWGEKGYFKVLFDNYGINDDVFVSQPLI